jgi:class 3 adenylate cyclase/tetratricopeptide (TPR) repeat protein
LPLATMMTLNDYQENGATLLKRGAPLIAYDTVAEGLRHFPGDTRLRQLLALALARTGATQEANRRLRDLVTSGLRDEETLGMLARTYKDLWGRAADAATGRHMLEQAFGWYRAAYAESGGYWSGINAATMALLLGRDEQSRALAREVRKRCLARRAQVTPGERYWLLATLGEAALLLGEIDAARSWYEEAVATPDIGVADLVSTRRNARLILSREQHEPQSLDDIFRIPQVAVFAGHMIDHPTRPTPRFPPHLEASVRHELSERLRRYDIGFGYASAANGGDILFLECLRELGAARHIVLPYNREQFVHDSVDFVPGAAWADRFRAALDDASTVTAASEQRMLGGAMSYQYGFLLLDGTAAIRAEELETPLICFAVWDGQEGDGPGGTAASIEHWRRMGRAVEIVDLRRLSSSGVVEVIPPPPNEAPPPEPPSAFDAELVGMLFADVGGFSKLTEEQIPAFVEHYLGAVARVLEASPERPLLVNTWGDGLYAVFRDVAETGACALRLSHELHATDWTAHGLPARLPLRIAVHAGPVYACTDPVTGRTNYLGAHVALAARIEPVTPPGVVYGSGAFAALAKAAQVRDFSCTYVGQTPLAKGYGTFPMYVLQPRVR